MFELLLAGGWLMVPLVLCSGAVAVITVERYISLRPARVVPPNLLGRVWRWLQEEDITAEHMGELRNSSPLGRILSAGLSNSGHGDRKSVV